MTDAQDVSSLAKKAKSGDEPPPRTAESRIPLPPVTPALKQKIIDVGLCPCLV